MVSVEVWSHNDSVGLELRTVVTFKYALEHLEAIKDEIDDIVEVRGCIGHFFRVHTGERHYNFKFTDKQIKSVKDYLTELNGGKIKERYVR